MCTKPKYSNPKPQEVIKEATQADASVQKANAENRTGVKALISQDIKTTNNGLDEEVNTSKKKLLGE
ncbi:hypothetical protein II906_02165 [bacterium]|nr:hypothetical protein [bacterium]